jgi:hypothetical protein
VEGSLILNPFQSIDLERFVKGSLNKGNRFKFVEITDAIADHRGIGVEDGLIQIEFEFERVFSISRIYPHWTYPTPIVTYGATCQGTTSGIYTNSVPCSMTASSQSAQSDQGITVPGSESEQQFSYAGAFFGDGEERSMIIKLRGQLKDRATLGEPVTVATKTQCPTCGKVNKISNKFCSECGTSLKVFA